jgi:hypothetical protein
MCCKRKGSPATPATPVPIRAAVASREEKERIEPAKDGGGSRRGGGPPCRHVRPGEGAPPHGDRHAAKVPPQPTAFACSSSLLAAQRRTPPQAPSPGGGRRAGANLEAGAELERGRTWLRLAPPLRVADAPDSASSVRAPSSTCVASASLRLRRGPSLRLGVAPLQIQTGGDGDVREGGDEW